VIIDCLYFFYLFYLFSLSTIKIHNYFFICYLSNQTFLSYLSHLDLYHYFLFDNGANHMSSALIEVNKKMRHARGEKGWPKLGLTWVSNLSSLDLTVTSNSSVLSLAIISNPSISMWEERGDDRNLAQREKNVIFFILT
jgi:hypothetical protein